MEIVREVLDHLKVKIIDLLNTTYALNIPSYYHRTWLSGKTDHEFIYYTPFRKHNGKELASYATFMEVPDFEKPKLTSARSMDWEPTSLPEDEVVKDIEGEEVEEGEVIKEPKEGEVSCEDEFENYWMNRGSGNGEDHSILFRMLKEGRLKFKGFRLLVDLHQIFYREPDYLARTKKVIMYAIHFKIVKRIDFSLWEYTLGDYCSCVPQDLFVEHISPMLRKLPEGIEIGYVNTCRPGYDSHAKYTDWECQYLRRGRRQRIFLATLY